MAMSSSEKKAIILVLLQAPLWALFPVIAHDATAHVPPITFGALSICAAAIVNILYNLPHKPVRELRQRAIWFPLIMITLSIVVIPFILYYLGAARSSGINTAMLLLAEVPFTLIFTHFIGERTTALKLAGSFSILAGAMLLLYQGSAHLRFGDLLIIASTALFPLGNMYAKKVLHYIQGSTILMMRFSLGAIFLLPIARLLEPNAKMGAIIQQYWWLILVNSVVVLTISKLIWYKALRHLDITKAIGLGMTFPLYSVGYLYFLGEKPTALQLLGIAIMLLGVYFTACRPSVDPQKTAYKKIFNDKL